MRDVGLDAKLEKLRGLFRDEFAAVSAEFEETTGKKALLGKFTRDSLKALEDDRLNLAARYVAVYLGDVRSLVLDSVVAGRRIRVEQILEDASGAMLRNLRTEINTSLLAYQRDVHLKKAEKADITKFLYVGPYDKVTRPFCREHVDHVYASDEIARMDNGQGLPVEIYCGGYNCRHHWRPISDSLAAVMEERGRRLAAERAQAEADGKEE